MQHCANSELLLIVITANIPYEFVCTIVARKDSDVQS